MLIEESLWLRAALADIPIERLSPLVNLGCSTEHFRTVEQPFVHENVIAPVEARGGAVLHVDMKADRGVDIAGDIFSDAVFEAILQRRPQAVLCASVLEHVRDPGRLIERCLALLPAGGHLILTVPRSFPYHPDPIDTGFRPSPQELEPLLRPAQMVRQSLVPGKTLLEELRANRRARGQGARLLNPFRDFARWLSLLHHLLWTFRRYEMTCVIAVKPPM